jgi:hypothetical protein
MQGDVRVRWRRWLVWGGSLLLPVPLMLLVSQLFHGGFVSGDATDNRFSPVLSGEERRQLLTFDHTCSGSEDCEPPLGCLQDFRRFNLSVCVGSECEADSQCPDGQVCRAIKTQGQGPLVRLCVAEGIRKEGQGCMRLTRKQELACEPELVCNMGYCGRPCDPGSPTGCPQGFVCREGPESVSCLPACEDGQCPQGQECIRQEGGFAACARVVGSNCQRTPCSQGQECRIGHTPGEGDRVTMECLTPCDDRSNSCPAGSVCFFGYCGRVCDPKREGTCGPGEFCNLHMNPTSREKFWFCSTLR